jgi:hypothetical protein
MLYPPGKVRYCTSSITVVEQSEVDSLGKLTKSRAASLSRRSGQGGNPVLPVFSDSPKATVRPVWRRFNTRLLLQFALPVKLLGSGPHVLLNAFLFFAGQGFYLSNILLCRCSPQQLIWRGAGIGKREIEFLSSGKLPIQLCRPSPF